MEANSWERVDEKELLLLSPYSYVRVFIVLAPNISLITRMN
jgi:hypothetical protein